MLKQLKTILLVSLISIFCFAEEDIEKIQVTGSHIKRIDTEGVSPITVIDQDQIQFSGASSVGELVQDLSSATFGATIKSALDDFNGTSITSFRGLPPGYILTLLNGKRLSNIDLDLIPLAAVERIEVVTDGASATYGSDALGGVMNIITKKGDVGGTFSTQAYVPEFEWSNWKKNKNLKLRDRFSSLSRGAESIKADFTYGNVTGDLQYLVALTVARTQKILAKDRDYFSLTEKDKKYFSSRSTPGSYQINDQWKLMPGCPGAPGSDANAKEKYPDSLYERNSKGEENCKFNYTNYMEIFPTVNSVGFFAHLNMSDIDLNLLYNYENSIGVLAPGLHDLIPGTNGITEETWTTWTQAVSNASNLPEFAQARSVRYRQIYEKGAGQRIQSTHKNLLSFNLSKETYLSDQWILDASFSANASLAFQNNKNYSDLRKLLSVTTDGVPKWNPLLDKDQKSDIRYATYEPKIHEHFALIVPEIKLYGELLDFQKGSLNLAIGGRGGYEYWSAGADKVTWDSDAQTSYQFGGGSQAIGKGGRSFATLYTELLAPMELNSWNTLELQLASSIDYYQYTGFASSKINLPFVDKKIKLPFNPKLAAKWSVDNTVSFRASFGTGFKAPALEYLFTESTKDHPFFIDHGCGQASCSSNQHEVVYIGNKNLEEEFAKTYNVGIIFEPSSNFYVSLDYFFNDIENMIQKPDGGFITKTEKTGGEAWETLRKKGDIKSIDRTNPSSIIVTSKFYNFGDYRSSGLDGSLFTKYDITSSEKLFFGIRTTYMLQTKTRNTSKDPFQSVLGNWGYPFYKISSQLGVEHSSGLKVSLNINGVSGFKDNETEPQASLRLESPHQQLINKIKGKKADYSVTTSIKKYETLSADQKQKTILKTPDFFSFDLTTIVPAPVFGLSDQSYFLFKIENILDTDLPKNTQKAGNKNLAQVLGTYGGVPDALYKGVNGRAYLVQYNYKF